MTRKISVLPPPPVDRMKELYQQVEQRIKELHGNYELSNQAVTRKIEGGHGWSATLRIGGSHILQEGLEELGRLVGGERPPSRPGMPRARERTPAVHYKDRTAEDPPHRSLAAQRIRGHRRPVRPVVPGGNQHQPGL